MYSKERYFWGAGSDTDTHVAVLCCPMVAGGLLLFIVSCVVGVDVL